LRLANSVRILFSEEQQVKLISASSRKDDRLDVSWKAKGQIVWWRPALCASSRFTYFSAAISAPASPPLRASDIR
jgi:hypothetical protein